METDETSDPEQVGFLCFIRHAPQTHKTPNLVQKTGWLRRYWGRDIHIHPSLSTVFIYSKFALANVKSLTIGGVIRTHSQNTGKVMKNDYNYLIELKSWNRKCGVIRPRCEQKRLARGRITPAVAVVIGHQVAEF